MNCIVFVFTFIGFLRFIQTLFWSLFPRRLGTEEGGKRRKIWQVQWACLISWGNVSGHGRTKHTYMVDRGRRCPFDFPYQYKKVRTRWGDLIAVL
ncbi:hypothetical protein LY78DRAFT_84461 [Colletotrichum sublineola]|nr:hypothetical protein LY78DRAFT_84461 [Colletotrichum sublineola]